MARTKVLNSSILSDPEFMTYPERVFKLYVFLYLQCWDDGLLHITTKWLRRNAYDGKSVSEKKIIADLELLEKRKWLKRYSVQDRVFVAMVRVSEDHKPKYPLISESIPFPPADVIAEFEQFGRYCIRVRQQTRERKLTSKVRQEGIEFPNLKDL